MRTKYFYKVVRVRDGEMFSLYEANPQVYRIGEKIECPYMFVYAPGAVMAELNPSRIRHGGFALLKVRAECQPKVYWVGDLSWSICGRRRNSMEIVKSALWSQPAYSRKLTVFLDALTPVSIVDLKPLLKDSEFLGDVIAPGRKPKWLSQAEVGDLCV